MPDTVANIITNKDPNSAAVSTSISITFASTDCADERTHNPSIWIADGCANTSVSLDITNQRPNYDATNCAADSQPNIAASYTITVRSPDYCSSIGCAISCSDIASTFIATHNRTDYRNAK